MLEIPESDVVFGGDSKGIFSIENASFHPRLQDGVKRVEYIELRNGADGMPKTLIFLEAKKTCPNGENRDSSEKKQKKFEEYYRDIAQKFTDSINLFAAYKLKRYALIEPPEGQNLAKQMDYQGIAICFVLVLTSANVTPDWLTGPKIELEVRLRSLCRVWGAKVLVLDYEMACRYGLATRRVTSR